MGLLQGWTASDRLRNNSRASLDAQQARAELRLGPDHPWHSDTPGPLASQPERDALQPQDAGDSAQASGGPEEVQGSATAARSDHESVQGRRREPFCRTHGMSAGTAADADSGRAVLRLPEYHRVSWSAVHVAARHLGQGPVLNPPAADGRIDVRPFMDRNA